jgi:hypothetical protein
MSREPDDPNVMRKILATKLGPKARFSRRLEDPLFHFAVTKSTTQVVSSFRKLVEVAG